MSTQPKAPLGYSPHTGDKAPPPQPKHTGEWTRDYVIEMTCQNNFSQVIADTHNDAVAKAVAIERGAGETNTPPDKPQEWTAERLKKSTERERLRKQLAVELEKREQSEKALSEEVNCVHETLKQLVAEREKVTLLGESRIAVDQAELLSLREKVLDLEQQLTSEREKWMELANANGWGKWSTEFQQLREELSAEREKVQTLVDALTQIKNAVCGDKRPNWTNDFQITHTRGWIADVIDAALAKVGK